MIFSEIIRSHYFLALAVVLFAAPASAAVYGSISGTVTDQSKSAVPGATLTLVNAGQGIRYRAVSDPRGAYSFLLVPVGRYDLSVEADGFERQDRTGVVVDLDATFHLDISLELAGRRDSVVVTEAAPVAVETASTQLGEAVSGHAIAAVALNGRSFTDLLALQPGIVPTTTQQPDSIVMAGVTVAIAPSGSLNPGNQSIGGRLCASP